MGKILLIVGGLFVFAFVAGVLISWALDDVEGALEAAEKDGDQ
jgi:hypothetical protein